MYLGSNPGVYDFATGRVSILRGTAIRPMQMLATRPYFTDADRRATPPAFSDFPASRRYSGRSATVLLPGPEERMFRTRLREIGAGPVAFAGDHAFDCFGSGTSNLVCAAVNKRTGAVIWAPGAIYHGMDARSFDDPGFQAVEYRVDSRMLILRGMVNETNPNGDHYYELRDGAFHLIRTIPKPYKEW